MGIISPKCILAGNCKEEKGKVIVHETAGIFTRGCIFYFKADAHLGAELELRRSGSSLGPSQ